MENANLAILKQASVSFQAMQETVNAQQTFSLINQSNSKLLNQLSAFLSLSKHQRQQRIAEIDKQKVHEFLKLFKLAPPNSFIDSTDEFIRETQNTIIKLDLIERQQSECIHQKQTFVYLLISGTIQPINQPGLDLFKNMNMTAPVLSKFFTQISLLPANSLYQSFNQQQSASHKNNGPQKVSSLSEMHYNTRKDLFLYIQKKANQTKFIRKSLPSDSISAQNHVKESGFKNSHWLGSESSRKNKGIISQRENKQNETNFELIEIEEGGIYECVTAVKYIRILKSNYNQLQQYVFKYQKDKLIQFLSKSLELPPAEVKYHQLHYKITHKNYKKNEFIHSKASKGLEQGSLYILREGSVELTYECKQAKKIPEVSPRQKLEFKQLKKNYRKCPHSQNDIISENTNSLRIVINKGAMICTELETSPCFILPIENTTFVEINSKLLEFLKSEMRKNWWTRKFLPSYKSIQFSRTMFIKEERSLTQEPQVCINLNNFSINTKNKFVRLSKSAKIRLRLDFNSEGPIPESNLPNKADPGAEQNSPEYQEFVSLLPYQIMVKSKQNISSKLNEKSKGRNVSAKVFNYLKKNQKSNSSSHKNKVMELKVKNIVGKQMNLKALDIYGDIDSSPNQKQFQRSLGGNWFKDECHSTEKNVSDGVLRRSSIQNTSEKKDSYGQKAKGTKSSTHIMALSKKFNDAKRKFANSTIHANESDNKKVTFALNHAETLEDQSDEEYLCNNDMGIINNFVKNSHNSHNYQKEISFLINSSQLQDSYQNHKKLKLKTCKTQASHFLFSHNLISNIMKRFQAVQGNSKAIPIPIPIPIPQIQIPQKSKSASQCPSFRKSLQIPADEPASNQPDSKDDPDLDPNSSLKNNSNIFSSLLTLMKPPTAELPVQEIKGLTHLKQQHKGSEYKNLKSNKRNSLTNCSESKRSSCAYLKSNHRDSPRGFQRRTFTEQSNPSRKETACAEIGFSLQRQQSVRRTEKQRRPMTAGDFCSDRLQCHSLLFNQWIQADPREVSAKENRNKDLGLPKYDFCDTNVSSGDKKIWMKMKTGKIVKKSINFNKNNSHSSDYNKKP